MVAKRTPSGTTPSPIPPSSTTSYKTTSSAASSQSHTTSTTKASSVTAPPTPKPSSTSNKSSASDAKSQDIIDIVTSVFKGYETDTPQRVKIIDAFLAFLVALGAVQFLYCLVAGNYPFNAFLAGFGATVGQFVLTVSLRMQTNPQNKKGNFEGISDERAFADFVLGSLVLHLFCVNFIN